MNKKSNKLLLSVVMLAFLLICATFFGCSLFGENTSEDKEYSIMYSANGVINTLKVKYGDLYTLERPVPEKEGYTFAGLYDAEEGGTQYVNSSGICVSPFRERNNIVLYPQFTPLIYTIVLDYGEASVVGSQTTTAQYGEQFPVLPVNLMVSDKYYMIFEGWFTEENCGGIQITDKSGFSAKILDKSIANLADSNRNIRLYAGFKAQTYNVSFYEQGGSTLIQKVEAEHGTDISTIMPSQTLDGKKILSWSTGNGLTYSGTIQYDLSLYVLSYECKVTLNYSYDNKQETILTANSNSYCLKQPVREGYTFLGWYLNGEQQSSIISLTEDIKLTAKWQPKNFLITYYVNPEEGQLSVKTKSINYGSSYTLAIPISLRDEYKFSGWSVDGILLTDSEGNSLSNWKIEDDTTVVAKWEKIIYTITLNAYYGTGSKTVEVAKNSTYTLPLCERTGYKLVGWYVGEVEYEDGYSFKVTQNRSFTAKWTPNSYNVYLDANGGNLGTTIAELQYDALFTLPVPTKEGSTFVGWYTSKTSSGNKIADKTGSSLGKWSTASDSTLYAIWLTDYTVAFNRQSCKTDNGFNPEETGRKEDTTAHSKFELIELICNGCVKNSDGSYFVPEGEELKLSIKVLQNVSSLPTGNQFGSVSWTVHHMANDSYNGQIYGTNITGQTIGYGAYYVKVTYTDGTISESNKVNFMKGAKKGDVIDLGINLSSKTISKIEIICVYELYYDYWMAFSFAHQYYANWRCTTILNFK